MGAERVELHVHFLPGRVNSPGFERLHRFDLGVCVTAKRRHKKIYIDKNKKGCTFRWSLGMSLCCFLQLYTMLEVSPDAADVTFA